MRHLFKSNFGQCQCRWCGRGRTLDECPVTHEMRYALKVFAQQNGRTWKSQLRHAWENCHDVGILSTLRNIIGPTQLMKISTRNVESVTPPPEAP